MLRRLSLLLLFAAACRAGDDSDISWIVNYDGRKLPGSGWTAVGSPDARLEAEGLRLIDSGKEFAHYRTNWKASPDDEVIVEAKVQTGAITGSQSKKPATSLWPWRDGAPVMIQVSDGRHQDGLVLFPAQATSFTDRFIPIDTASRMHVYRLVIHGTTMSMWVDGERKVTGENAFWKKADSPEPFIQFGSSAKAATGEALWAYVKLGVRKAKGPPPQPVIKLTLSQPWDLPARDDVKQTRPYLFDMGQGLLLVSVAQGPDAFYEPYGVLKSTDAGKTWSPILGLDKVDTAPLPLLRRPDGSILGASRWTRLMPDGSVQGKTVKLNADATAFTMIDSQINLPAQYMNETKNDQIICERQIWNDPDGGATMLVWSRKNVKRPDGRNNTERWSHLVRTTDEGRTWNHVSVVGPGGEPAACRLNAIEMIALTRGDRNSLLRQMFSHDGGKTWSKPEEQEVGKVMPDLELMSNGVLACSYGRPASCLMFSFDGGKSWPSHHVISERVGFNYTSIREISPGRLLYMHDAPKMCALYVDVEKN